MSIASRIESIEEHIGNAYDSIEALGVDITDVDKNIENISSSIDGIFETLPKVTDEGESISLDGTIKGRLKTTLKGNTSQNGTPTPSTPIPVNVVSGDNEITISSIVPQRIGGYLASTSGTGIFKTGSDDCMYFPVISGHTYKYSSTGNRSRSAIFTNIPTNDTYTIEGTYLTTTPKTFTASATGYMVLYINTPHDQSVVDTFSVYDTSYYTTYPINLPEGMELCKIGDYEDTFIHDKTLDKWYLHKEVGEVVLNGTESWIFHSTQNSINSYRISLNNFIVANILSDKYQYQVWASFNSNSRALNRVSMLISGSNYYLYMSQPNNEISTVEQFRAWLLDNNVLIYLPLATPTDTEITYQPLIEQLNAIEKAMSYNGQTNISQVNNELPFIISASALKEWQESNVSTLSMVNPLSLGNTLNTQENDIQPIEVDNIEPLEEEEYEES